MVKVQSMMVGAPASSIRPPPYPLSVSPSPLASPAVMVKPFRMERPFVPSAVTT